jgi:protein-tyrosine phosphatase
MSSPFRIITVCTGNICRSPMAELLLTHAFKDAGLADDVVVDSAGTTSWEVGRPIDERAAHKLGLHGITSTNHRARQFEPGWYRDRDLILALDLDHYEQLRRDAPDPAARSKVHLLREFDPASAGRPVEELGIYDPWFGDAADFNASWELMHPAVDGIVAFVRRQLDSRLRERKENGTDGADTASGDR